METMSIAEETKNIVEEIVSSYEDRMQSIGSIFDVTHQVLEGFQNSFLNTKQKREKINAELRENLAKNWSLRRKDFDNMMQGILLAQEEREEEVRNLLNRYLSEQKEMADVLRDNFTKVKDSLTRGEVQRVKEFQVYIKEILAKQDSRKDEVSSKLREFQKEQQEIVKSLEELSAKGRNLRIKDFKLMLEKFKTPVMALKKKNRNIAIRQRQLV